MLLWKEWVNGTDLMFPGCSVRENSLWELGTLTALPSYNEHYLCAAEGSEDVREVVRAFLTWCRGLDLMSLAVLSTLMIPISRFLCSCVCSTPYLIVSTLGFYLDVLMMLFFKVMLILILIAPFFKEGSNALQELNVLTKFKLTNWMATVFVSTMINLPTYFLHLPSFNSDKSLWVGEMIVFLTFSMLTYTWTNMYKYIYNFFQTKMRSLLHSLQCNLHFLIKHIMEPPGFVFKLRRWNLFMDWRWWAGVGFSTWKLEFSQQNWIV